MFSVISFLLLLLSTAHVFALPAAPRIIPRAGPTIADLDIKFEGNGCKPGEVSAALASDGSALNIIYDNFSAADGPKDGNAPATTFCRMTIGMKKPGWAFDISSTDFRGYIYAEKGVQAVLVNEWNWIDKNGREMEEKGTINKTIQGPFEEDFLLHADGEISKDDSAICAKKDAKLQMTLFATIAAGNSQADGYMYGNSVDSSFGTFDLALKKC